MNDWDSEDWQNLGPYDPDCQHLWLRAAYGGLDPWQFVSGELGIFEFRKCVICDAKQLRDPPS